MKQITGEEFVKNIERDPSWCLSIIEPLEITTYADLVESEITHLSPLLHFKGLSQGNVFKRGVASFSNCKNLKEATGTFYGHVIFFNSSLVRANINVTLFNENGWSASFQDCKLLKILEGEFEGAVQLYKSGIEVIKATVNTPIKASFRDFDGVKFAIGLCDSLPLHEKYLKKEYQADIIFKDKIIEKLKLRKELSRISTPFETTI